MKSVSFKNLVLFIKVIIAACLRETVGKCACGKWVHSLHMQFIMTIGTQANSAFHHFWVDKWVVKLEPDVRCRLQVAPSGESYEGNRRPGRK